MREIGTIENEAQARQFGDFLLVRGIDNRLEEEDGTWTVWIISEDKIAEAKNLFTRFQEDPAIPQAIEITEKARKLRAKRRAENETFQKMMKKSKVSFQTATTFGRLTLILIIISVGVFLISGFGRNIALLRILFISNYQIAAGLPEIFHGQIWRLITPVFIHFSFLHILFNMWWLKDLGTMIENRHSTAFFALLVFSIGVISNLGQFFISGPIFGGMSGVVYGLLGYIWMRGKFDPLSGFFLPNWIVVMMIGWFFLGFTGLIGPIANAAHGVGLVVGMAWGYILARLSPHFRK